MPADQCRHYLLIPLLRSSRTLPTTPRLETPTVSYPPMSLHVHQLNLVTSSEVSCHLPFYLDSNRPIRKAESSVLATVVSSQTSPLDPLPVRLKRTERARITLQSTSRRMVRRYVISLASSGGSLLTVQSYQAALRDAVPPYWDTTVVLPSSSSPFGPLTSSLSGDEILIDGMPSGNFFGFLWNRE